MLEQRLSDDLPPEVRGASWTGTGRRNTDCTMPVFGRSRSKSEIKTVSSRMARSTSRSNADRPTTNSSPFTQGNRPGDKIKGAIETTVDGEERKSDWEAKRVDW